METSVKEKLHEYIDHADEKKVLAIYTLVQGDIEDRSELYDEAALNSFRETSKNVHAGKEKGSSVKESMERIRKQIK
jgi:hypothetical protein